MLRLPTARRVLLSSSPRSALPPIRWRPSALPGSWGTCCARALLSDSGETSVPNLEGVPNGGSRCCRRLPPPAGAPILARHAVYAASQPDDPPFHYVSAVSST